MLLQIFYVVMYMLKIIKGNYGFGSKIELRNNKLKHFNASTFQTILEKIAENSGYPFAYIDITGSN